MSNLILLAIGAGILYSVTKKRERRYRLREDAYGFSKGDVVTESELTEAIENSESSYTGFSTEGTDYTVHDTCKKCGATDSDLTTCDWCEKEICDECCYHQELYGDFCNQNCFNSRWAYDNYD